MEYRSLGRSGLRVSEVGLGCEHLQGMSYDDLAPVIDAALDRGINIIDIFMSEPNVRTHIGQALAGRRDKVIIQGHIGAVWEDGQYKRSRDEAQCRAFFQDILDRLQTDYMDIGMIHYVDTPEDLDEVMVGPVLAYAKELKAKGIIRAIGMSSHSPQVARRAVEAGIIDVLMFSLNPAYDILPEDTDIDNLFNPESYQDPTLTGINPARADLYRACEAHGVGITVMKGLGGGILLNAQASPFGMALAPVQCIHYALTRPAVGSILVGCRTPEEVAGAVAYEAASDTERDYAEVLRQTPKFAMEGVCMYCNHCLPCPSRIDIAAVNKYLDLATLTGSVPESVAAHYGDMPTHASDCIACGSCEGNCPFHVPVISRMEKAQEVFGK